MTSLAEAYPVGFGGYSPSVQSYLMPDNRRGYQVGGAAELQRSSDKRPVRFRPRINEAFIPRKRFERAMLEGRVPVTRSGLRYAQGPSLMDPKPDASPRGSIWDAPFGTPTKGLTPAQNLWLLANAATLPVTGTTGLVGLGALYGSGYAPDIPAGERVDPETGETIPATKIKDMFKKENRIPSIRQHWKEGQKGTAALQAGLGIGLPLVARGAQTMLARTGRGPAQLELPLGTGGLGGMPMTRREFFEKTGLTAAGLGALASGIGKVSRPASTAAAGTTRMDVDGFMGVINKLSKDRKYRPNPLHLNRNALLKVPHSGGSVLAKYHPDNLHTFGLTAQEHKGLGFLDNLWDAGKLDRYGLTAHDFSRIDLELLERFHLMGRFKPKATANLDYNPKHTVELFEIHGVPVIQDASGSVFVPNATALVKAQKAQALELVSNIDPRFRKVINQRTPYTPQEARLARAAEFEFDKIPLAGRGDIGKPLGSFKGISAADEPRQWEGFSKSEKYATPAGGWTPQSRMAHSKLYQEQGRFPETLQYNLSGQPVISNKMGSFVVGKGGTVLRNHGGQTKWVIGPQRRMNSRAYLISDEFGMFSGRAEQVPMGTSSSSPVARRAGDFDPRVLMSTRDEYIKGYANYLKKMPWEK